MAYRVVGYIDAYYTGSGVWSTVSVVQGAGGNALSPLFGFGNGQTYSSKTVGVDIVNGTTYYNTSGKPIAYFLYAGSPSGIQYLSGYVDGVLVTRAAAISASSEATLSLFVPPNLSFKFVWTTSNPTIYALA